MYLDWLNEQMDEDKICESKWERKIEESTNDQIKYRKKSTLQLFGQMLFGPLWLKLRKNPFSLHENGKKHIEENKWFRKNSQTKTK